MLEIKFPLMLISTCMFAQGRVKVERFNCSKPAKRKLRNEKEVVVLCNNNIKNSNAVLFSLFLLLAKNCAVPFFSINIHKRILPANTQTKPQSP